MYFKPNEWIEIGTAKRQPRFLWIGERTGAHRPQRYHAVAHLRFGRQLVTVAIVQRYFGVHVRFAVKHLHVMNHIRVCDERLEFDDVMLLLDEIVELLDVAPVGGLSSGHFNFF